MNILDGDEALQHVVVVHYQELFHAVAVQDFLGLLESGADRNGDQVLLSHHLRDGHVGAGLKAQVAIGQDADQLAVLGDRHARDAIAPHDFQRIGNLLVRGDSHRVDDHAALTALDAVHFLGLALDGHVAVNDPDAALLRQCDGQMRLGNGVHGGADNRNIEGDIPGQAGSRVGVGRQHLASRRLKNQIIEGETFGDARIDHGIAS